MKEPRQRNYDTAVLNACSALLFEKSHQDQIFQLVDSMNLSLICLTTNQGEEVNALVHVDDVSQICNSNFTKAIPVSNQLMTAETLRISKTSRAPFISLV